MLPFSPAPAAVPAPVPGTPAATFPAANAQGRPPAAKPGDKFLTQVVDILGPGRVLIRRNLFEVRVRVHGLALPGADDAALLEAARQFTAAALRSEVADFEVKSVNADGEIIASVTTAAGKNVGPELVRAGLARWDAVNAPGERLLADAEASARDAKRGIWAHAAAAPMVASAAPLGVVAGAASPAAPPPVPPAALVLGPISPAAPAPPPVASLNVPIAAVPIAPVLPAATSAPLPVVPSAATAPVSLPALPSAAPAPGTPFADALARPVAAPGSPGAPRATIAAATTAAPAPVAAARFAAAPVHGAADLFAAPMAASRASMPATAPAAFPSPIFPHPEQAATQIRTPAAAVRAAALPTTVSVAAPSVPALPRAAERGSTASAAAPAPAAIPALAARPSPRVSIAAPAAPAPAPAAVLGGANPAADPVVPAPSLAAPAAVSAATPRVTPAAPAATVVAVRPVPAPKWPARQDDERPVAAAASAMSEADRYKMRWVFTNLDAREVRRYRAAGFDEATIRGAANIALRTGLELGYVLRRIQDTGYSLTQTAVMYGVPTRAVDEDIPGFGA